MTDLARGRTLVKVFVRGGWLLGLVVLCLWQRESDWPPARAILRWVPPLVQGVALVAFFLGCVWVVMGCLVVRPFRQDWQRMKALGSTASTPRDGHPLWDQNIDH